MTIEHQKSLKEPREKLQYQSVIQQSVKGKSEKLKEINRFGPFVHGTSSYSGNIIDEVGLNPRGAEISEYEEANMPSKSDRVYFASAPRYLGSCFGAMENACENACEVPWVEGEFFVLQSIPPEFSNYLRMDEDCKIVDKSCRTPLQSLETIGSLAIAKKIPRKYLVKKTPKQFYKFVKQYSLEKLPPWKEFITERIRDKDGDNGVREMKKNFPELFLEDD